jgi:hypothetical protein
MDYDRQCTSLCLRCMLRYLVQSSHESQYHLNSRSSIAYSCYTLANHILASHTSGIHIFTMLIHIPRLLSLQVVRGYQRNLVLSWCKFSVHSLCWIESGPNCWALLCKRGICTSRHKYRRIRLSCYLYLQFV